MVWKSDNLSIFIGQGLGVGTNTGWAISNREPYNSSLVSWNILIDNSFATAFFQIGLIGSIWLWGGVFRIICETAARKSISILISFAVFLVTQNIFEQYFLMIALAVSSGLVVNGSYSRGVNSRRTGLEGC